MQTMLDTSTLVIEECCDCHTRFAMTSQLRAARYADHKAFYCPNGHGQSYVGETEEAKLRRQLKAAKSDATWTRDQLEASERSKAAIKGHLTRARNKLAKGQCPCCDQTFGNVREHMKARHPEYHLTDIDAAAAVEESK
jgi:hypothetical protein